MILFSSSTPFAERLHDILVSKTLRAAVLTTMFATGISPIWIPESPLLYMLMTLCAFHVLFVAIENRKIVSALHDEKGTFAEANRAWRFAHYRGREWRISMGDAPLRKLGNDFADTRFFYFVSLALFVLACMSGFAQEEPGILIFALAAIVAFPAVFPRDFRGPLVIDTGFSHSMGRKQKLPVRFEEKKCGSSFPWRVVARSDFRIGKLLAGDRDLVLSQSHVGQHLLWILRSARLNDRERFARLVSLLVDPVSKGHGAVFLDTSTGRAGIAPHAVEQSIRRLAGYFGRGHDVQVVKIDEIEKTDRNTNGDHPLDFSVIAAEKKILIVKTPSIDDRSFHEKMDGFVASLWEACGRVVGSKIAENGEIDEAAEEARTARHPRKLQGARIPVILPDFDLYGMSTPTRTRKMSTIMAMARASGLAIMAGISRDIDASSDPDDRIFGNVGTILDHTPEIGDVIRMSAGDDKGPRAEGYAFRYPQIVDVEMPSQKLIFWGCKADEPEDVMREIIEKSKARG